MRVILPEGSFEWDLDTFNAVSSKTILRRYRHPNGLRVTTHRDFDRFFSNVEMISQINILLKDLSENLCPIALKFSVSADSYKILYNF